MVRDKVMHEKKVILLLIHCKVGRFFKLGFDLRELLIGDFLCKKEPDVPGYTETEYWEF